MQTVWDHVRLAADRTPDRTAIVDDRSERSLSYTGLVEEVETVAAGLSAIGIGPGDRVATALPNFLDHAILLLAVHRLGAVRTPAGRREPPGGPRGGLTPRHERRGPTVPARALTIG